VLGVAAVTARVGRAAGSPAGQLAFADPGEVRLAGIGRVQLAHGGPERGQRPAVARVIPHAGRDRPARPGHPAHLPQALHRISHEMDDQLRQRGAERAVGERQLPGRRLPDVRSWQTFPRRGGNDADGSTALTDSAPTRLANSAVSAPGPHPTSSTRWPRRTPARSANCAASGSEYRPMNCM
jgi:hypothetical protein